jgi:hypothetical protein
MLSKQKSPCYSLRCAYVDRCVCTRSLSHTHSHTHIHTYSHFQSLLLSQTVKHSPKSTVCDEPRVQSPPSYPTLYVPRISMVRVPECPMLSVLKRKISARKKKKESVWRDPRTSSSLVVAFASVLLLLLLAPLGQVEASGTELVHLFGGAQFDKAKCVIEHSIDTGLVIAGQTLSFWAERPSGYNDDMFLVKTDSVGEDLWRNQY